MHAGQTPHCLELPRTSGCQIQEIVIAASPERPLPMREAVISAFVRSRNGSWNSIGRSATSDKSVESARKKYGGVLRVVRQPIILTDSGTLSEPTPAS